MKSRPDCFACGGHDPRPKEHDRQCNGTGEEGVSEVFHRSSCANCDIKSSINYKIFAVTLLHGRAGRWYVEACGSPPPYGVPARTREDDVGRKSWLQGKVPCFEAGEGTRHGHV